MTQQLDEILHRLESRGCKPKKGGDGHYYACCPGHDDDKPSLSIADGDKGVILKCHAECDLSAILEPLHLKPSDLFYNHNGHQNGTHDTAIAYVYTDEEGGPLHRTVRTEPKGFFQQHWDGQKWVKGLSQVRRVLYELPKVVQAIAAGEIVYLVEGEKDAEKLLALGFTATTNPMGAGAWRPEYTQQLAGAHVVILPDNDQPGRDHAEAVQVALAGVATSVKVVGLPDLPEKGDVSDWFAAGRTVEELLKIVRSTPEVTVCDLKAFKNTDSGNAERFAALYQNLIRYVPPRKSWLVWAGSHWVFDEKSQATFLMKMAARKLLQQSVGETDDQKRAVLVKWATDSEGAYKIHAALSLVPGEPGMSILPSELDSDPWHLNVQNGTVDLRTGELHGHRREDYLTKICPVDYDPAARAPRWVQFLDEIFLGRQDLIDYIQRAVGYSASGSVRDKVLFFLFGPSGDNGKTTFVETLMDLLSGYSQKAKLDLLTARTADGGPTEEIATLKGARLVVASEIEEEAWLAVARVKDLTGTDTLRARFLHQNSFEFKPSHKLWIYGNHKLNVPGGDNAIWNRVHLIPFDASFPVGHHQRDDQLREKLEAEKSGILNWIIEGCLAWQKLGLLPPTTITNATKEYRSEQDIIKQFLDEECTLGPHLEVSTKVLYNHYKEWAEETGLKPYTRNRLGRRLTELGIVITKVNPTKYLGVEPRLKVVVNGEIVKGKL